MRIQGPSDNQLGVGSPSARAGHGDATTAPSGASSAVANVSVSTTAQAISQSQASSQSERAQKVASLKVAVAGGSYRVDRQALSERMADEEMARAGAR